MRPGDRTQMVADEIHALLRPTWQWLSAWAISRRIGRSPNIVKRALHADSRFTYRVRFRKTRRLVQWQLWNWKA